MQLETFRGRDLSRVLAEVRNTFGDDAMIVRTRTEKGPSGTVVEVVATTGRELDRFRQRIEREPDRPARRRARGKTRPYTVALVGSTGAGKTTTTAKLALHPRGFGGRNVGLITLDTYRVAALEQLGTYAEIIGLPMEVVYAEAEIDGVLARLADCDVVLVDTPGRGLTSPPKSQPWRALLERLAPDEVHLVVPASTRTDVALAMRDAFTTCGTTHMLLTKLDEVPGELGVTELAQALDLPARWVTTGQEVPADLHPAGARLVHSLCADPARSGMVRGVA